MCNITILTDIIDHYDVSYNVSISKQNRGSKFVIVAISQRQYDNQTQRQLSELLELTKRLNAYGIDKIDITTHNGTTTLKFTLNTN